MIKQFNIANFKAFRDQPLSLSPLTLLTGLNGSGKSSVLQALLVLRQSFDQGLLQVNRLASDGALLRLGTRQDALFEGANEDPPRIGFELTSYMPEKSFSHRWSFEFDSKDDRMSKKAPCTSPSSIETWAYSVPVSSFFRRSASDHGSITAWPITIYPPWD